MDSVQRWTPQIASGKVGWGGCKRCDCFHYLEVRYELKEGEKEKNGQGRVDAVWCREGTSAVCLLLTQGDVPTGPHWEGLDALGAFCLAP